MDRHTFAGKKSWVAVLAVSTLMMNTALPGYADDWGDILKPLVKDVLVPGAQLGVKTWKNYRKNAESKKSDKTSTDSAAPANIDWGPPPPPPPVTSSDGILPTPEGPLDSLPPPPPPPVEASAFSVPEPPATEQPQVQVQVSEGSALVPMAPDNLTVKLTQQENARYATLDWQDNAPDETGYEIWSGLSENGEFKAIQRVKANITTWAQHYPSPPPDAGIFYKVRAFNGQGYSDFSNTVKFTRN